jgi:hypothetical protein
VADRVRVAASRKRGGAKRPAKKARRRQPGIIFLAAIAALIIGFLARRMMLPSAVHYIAHRPAEEPRRAGDVESPATTDDGAESNARANQDGGSDSEHLTTGDRRELDAIIKHKAK